MDEPSVVALNEAGALVAAGRAAVELAHREPRGGHRFVTPFRHGVVRDRDASVQLLRWALRAVNRPRGRRLQAVVSAPVGSSNAERKVLTEVVAAAGVEGRISILDEPLAAAIGAGLPVSESYGCMVLDIGAGITEAAIVAGGGLVAFGSARLGCGSVTRAVAQHLAEHHALVVDRPVARKIWTTVVAEAVPGVAVVGRDRREGAEREVVLDRSELDRLLQPRLDAMAAAAQQALQRAPESLAADVMQHGLALVGGGGAVAGMQRTMEERVAIPVFPTAEPLLAVAFGGAACLGQPR